MNSIKLVLLFVTVLTQTPFVTAASNGTLTITGNIRNNSCIVSISSQNFTVDMGANALKQLNRVGSSSNLTPFSIVFSSCGGAASGVRIGFEGIADTSDSTILKNDTGPGMATGIGVEIMDSTQVKIPLNASGNTLNWTALTPSAPNTINFYSKMVNTTGSAAPGNISATANFTLEYL